MSEKDGHQKLLEAILQKVTKNEQDNQEILTRLHDMRYKNTRSISLDEMYQEFSNRFSLDDDVNYLYIKFCESNDYEYKESDIINLVHNLDSLSVEYVKSWLLKRIMRVSTKYNLLRKAIPKRIVKHMTPKHDHELLDHPQRFFHHKDTINFRKKYNLDACYGLLAKGAGVDFLPRDTINSIQNGAVIDGGSFDGQTAIVFATYAPTKVYAFDPIQKHFANIQKTIDDNNFTDQVELVPYGLDEKDNEFVIELEAEGPATTLLSRDNSSDKKMTESYLAKTTSIDNFVKKNNIEKISLIKLDVEGFEQKVIAGMLDTLKRDKPALLISIYHTIDDFMKIKPIIENLDLGYNLTIRHLEPTLYDSGYEAELDFFSAEYMLIAYV